VDPRWVGGISVELVLKCIKDYRKTRLGAKLADLSEGQYSFDSAGALLTPKFLFQTAIRLKDGPFQGGEANYFCTVTQCRKRGSVLKVKIKSIIIHDNPLKNFDLFTT
jgi:hypothetical protein